MSFLDAIPLRTKKTIASWGLSDSLNKQLYKSLREELRLRATDDFKKVVAPIRALILYLTVDDPESSEQRDFIFWINYTETPGTRVVIDAKDCSQPPEGELTGRTLEG